MIPKRVWQELRRQPRWWLRLMLFSAGCTFAALLMRGPNEGFGGPVLYFAALSSSGVLLTSSIVLLLWQSRTGSGDR